MYFFFLECRHTIVRSGRKTKNEKKVMEEIWEMTFDIKSSWLELVNTLTDEKNKTVKIWWRKWSIFKEERVFFFFFFFVVYSVGNIIIKCFIMDTVGVDLFQEMAARKLQSCYTSEETRRRRISICVMVKVHIRGSRSCPDKL